MKKFPFVSDELLKALEEHFPDSASRRTDLSLAEHGARAGEQKVLDVLRHHNNKQNILEG